MLNLDDIAEVIAGAVKEATDPLKAEIEALKAKAAIVPENGLQGPQGDAGEKGQDGKDGLNGKDGNNGRDGIGLADALINRDGALILTMTDGSVKNLGVVHGKDGEAFTLDDFDIEPLDERTIKMGFEKGEVKHTFELTFPVPIDRGVFSAETKYERGDAVSWGGSLWIAQKDEPGKPDTADSGWRLAVKRGRAGKGVE